MKFTNNYNIPEGLAMALKGDDYDLAGAPANILSVTSMLNPPKIRQLERRHWDEIEVDVSEKVFQVMGQATHARINHYDNGDNKLTEERWYMNLETLEVYTLGYAQRITKMDWYNQDTYFLSGRFDSYEQLSEKEGVIDDYKVTSAWSVVYDKEAKPDYVKQLNVYAYALRKVGFPVTKGRIVAILRDWSKSQMVKSGSSYPQIPIHVWDVQMLNEQLVEDVIRTQVRKHIQAEDMTDDEIPECNPMERWAKADTWAVMKDGRKTAVKVCHDEDEAIQRMEQEKAAHPKDSYYIEKRDGEDVRCAGYCSVGKAGLCNYYNSNVTK